MSPQAIEPRHGIGGYGGVSAANVRHVVDIKQRGRNRNGLEIRHGFGAGATGFNIFKTG